MCSQTGGRGRLLGCNKAQLQHSAAAELGPAVKKTEREKRPSRGQPSERGDTLGEHRLFGQIPDLQQTKDEPENKAKKIYSVY